MGRWSKLVCGRIAGASLALCASGCDVTLLRGLSREQANDAVAALDHSGVVGRIVAEDGTGSRQRIDVSDSAVADAVAALNARRERAQCPAEQQSPPVSRWIETPGEERARHAERLTQQLERSLSRLPGVVEAHVHLSLPFGMRSLPQAQTPATASVLLVHDAKAPLRGAAAELVAGAVPGLSPNAVRVVETAPQPTAATKPEFTRFGSVVVTRDSAGTLKVWLASSLVLHMLLAAALLRPVLRRRSKPQPPVSPAPPAADEPPASAGS